MRTILTVRCKRISGYGCGRLAGGLGGTCLMGLAPALAGKVRKRSFADTREGSRGAFR